MMLELKTLQQDHAENKVLMETAVKAQNQMIRELEEEIAVKEAQVKQYQKQVEAYLWHHFGIGLTKMHACE